MTAVLPFSAMRILLCVARACGLALPQCGMAYLALLVPADQCASRNGDMSANGVGLLGAAGEFAVRGAGVVRGCKSISSDCQHTFNYM
ncbi:MAG: hypothetical protein CVT80_04800 [Alphaproteobacteria bacterium HGW-Alphaproteobacteria-2]|nr:MAG: hypothetical protein CVT80_04800 [Alphaproteobacteria bacterium HGW-Alphaproteobacteria-2]